MATTTTVTQSYWTVCWEWIFPYPCKQSRTVTIYEYFWSSLTETGYGFFSKLVGCENQIRYQWWDWSFNVWGSTTYYNLLKDYDSPRPQSGTCPPPGDTGVIL